MTTKIFDGFDGINAREMIHGEASEIPIGRTFSTDSDFLMARAVATKLNVKISDHGAALIALIFSTEAEMSFHISLLKRELGNSPEEGITAELIANTFNL